MLLLRLVDSKSTHQLRQEREEMMEREVARVQEESARMVERAREESRKRAERMEQEQRDRVEEERRAQETMGRQVGELKDRHKTTL